MDIELVTAITATPSSCNTLLRVIASSLTFFFPGREPHWDGPPVSPPSIAQRNAFAPGIGSTFEPTIGPPHYKLRA